MKGDLLTPRTCHQWKPVLPASSALVPIRCSGAGVCWPAGWPGLEGAVPFSPPPSPQGRRLSTIVNYSAWKCIRNTINQSPSTEHSISSFHVFFSFFSLFYSWIHFFTTVCRTYVCMISIKFIICWNQCQSEKYHLISRYGQSKFKYDFAIFIWCLDDVFFFIWIALI